METQATQPNTQPIFDLYGSRQRSPSLAVEDLTDIIVQLRPISAAAFQAVEFCRKHAPQHVLDNERLCEADHTNGREGPPLNPVDSEDNGVESTQPLDPKASYPSSQVLALRMSSQVKDVKLGFVFGRNEQKCDIVIQTHHQRIKVSQLHFRIYLNDEGILMIEDCSTNGTFIDNLCLKRGTDQVRRMLEHGSMIDIITITDAETKMSEKASFFVAIPKLTGAEMEARYRTNVRDYIAFREQARMKANQQRMPNRNMLRAPDATPSNRTGLADSLIGAGSARFHHGMRWDGGSRYRPVKQIGRGAYATVYAIARQDTGEIYAAKEIEKGRLTEASALDTKIENEVKIMKKVSHPHIVELFDSHDSGTHLYLILEYMPCGDLREYLKPGITLSEDFAQRITYQLCRGVKHIHAMNITHRDIKPDNILLKSRDPIWIKISDFGLSKVIEEEEGNVLKTFCGTLAYCAPEVFPHYAQWNGLPTNTAPKGRRARYDQKVDIWSTAAVIFELLVRGYAYPAETGGHWGDAMLKCIMGTKVNWSRITRAGYSETAMDFLQAMLKVIPAERPSAQQCLQHPWIRDIPDFETAPSQLNVDDLNNGLAEHIDHLNAGLSPDLSYSDFPDIDDGLPTPHVPIDNVRLFGEVGKSGFADSGLFGIEPPPAIRLPALDSASSGLPIPSRSEEEALDSTVSQIEDLRVGPKSTLERPELLWSPSFKRAREEEEDPHELDSRVTFKKPMREQTHLAENVVIGRLVPVEGSFSDTVIELTDRIAVWGRFESCSHPWPDDKDVRIPRFGMDLIFWGPGVKDDSVPRSLWHTLADTHVYLKTRSTTGLTVNGVKFPRQKSTVNDLYGELRTGDIIEVLSAKPALLAYRCEFYMGASKEPRQLGENFYLEMQPEISRLALGLRLPEKPQILLQTRTPSSDRSSSSSKRPSG